MGLLPFRVRVQDAVNLTCRWTNMGIFAVSCVPFSTLNMGYMLSCVDTFLGSAYNSTKLHENQAIVWRDSNEVEDLLDIHDTYERIVPIVMYCDFL